MINKPKKKNIFLKIIGSSVILSSAFFLMIVICVLMILNFFGVNITSSNINNNYEYAGIYKESLNKNFKNGYVPLARILYFYLENDNLTFDEIYSLNINSKFKNIKDVHVVCENSKLKNMVACTNSNINDNENFLAVPEQYFNFPLKNNDYTITSFFNEERIVYGKSNVHSGWDFAIDERTPIYSVCDGIVTNVNYTQDKNIPYNLSQNMIGNSITIQCEDYLEKYSVTYRHLYPNSSKVKVGDKVNHWSEIASVGTTGHSTGNHLHYEVIDSNNNLVDGMLLVNMNYIKQC